MNTMRVTLQLPIDSKKEDMGVVAMIEANRDLFERTGGREHIAGIMEKLLADGGTGGRRSVTRQMVEKWFNPKRRTIPSGVLLVTLLAACQIIKAELEQIKNTTKTKTKVSV